MAANSFRIRELNEEEDKKVKSSFEKFDLNGDGKLDKVELQQALMEMKMEGDDNDVNEIFKKVDLDNSGFIEYSEYERMMKIMYYQWECKIKERELRRTFRKFDRDKNGTLDKYEFRRAMRQIARMDKNESDDWFDKADLDGNGNISIEEFLSYFLDLEKSEQEVKGYFHSNA